MDIGSISDIAIAGVPLIIFVVGLVEFIKKFNVQGKWLTVAAMVLGVVLMVFYQLGKIYPEVNLWLTVVVTGIMIGATAAGLYDFSKGFRSR